MVDVTHLIDSLGYVQDVDWNYIFVYWENNSASIQFLIDYIQSIYPTWLRLWANSPDSLVSEYDEVRATMLQTRIDQRQKGINNIFVATADEDGVTEWENFPKLPVDTSLSLATRKAKLIVRLSGNNSTIANIRTVIETFIGTSPYTITELWKILPFDPADTWTYTIDLYNPQPARFINEMKSVIMGIQPAHCLLVMSYTYPLLDAVATQDVLASWLHDSFIWWIEGSPQPTDGVWASESTPLLWSYRS